jgi:4-amino-4-deoxy-L-arabinose transferase-like glycosyltransferase
MGVRRGLGLIALAVAARALYWLATHHYTPTSDADSFLQIATNFANGDGLSANYPGLELHPTAFRPPAFPLVLGSAFWVFGTSVGLARLVNLVIGVGVVVLSERAGTRIGGPTAGLLAAIFVAIYPPLVANDVTILAESLALLLVLLVVLTVADGRWQLAGAATGLLVLTRHSAQLLPFVIAIAIVVWFGWRKAAGFVGIAVLVVTPWVIRNQVQLGSPVLNTANGFNLAARYSEEAHQTGDFVDPTKDARFDDLRLAQLDEVVWDRALRTRGLDGLREHPLDVLRVMAQNNGRWLELQPSFNDVPDALDGRDLTIRHVSLPFFYVVTVAGIAGLWRARHSRVAMLLLVMAVYFMLVSLVSLTAPRLRAPFDLACCIGAGVLVSDVVTRRRRTAHVSRSS